MKDIKKYQGVIPAFYACYDAEGNISTEGVKALTRHLIAKGVKGVYVGGSSGECIYQHVDERKAVLEAVMSEAKGKLTVIAHVGCNNTADSVELARHAESVGVDAIASIPPLSPSTCRPSMQAWNWSPDMVSWARRNSTTWKSFSRSSWRIFSQWE